MLPIAAIAALLLEESGIFIEQNDEFKEQNIPARKKMIVAKSEIFFPLWCWKARKLIGTKNAARMEAAAFRCSNLGNMTTPSAVPVTNGNPTPLMSLATAIMLCNIFSKIT
ncbi:MAG: hypothetical protein PUK70_04270 [Bacteroidales bacterium]|nr:hypothetical protein [Bacteroidales bacterium]MDY6001694.1 hypothetical protein [Candidatus Cryptobacteroides sp.]